MLMGDEIVIANLQVATGAGEARGSNRKAP